MNIYNEMQYLKVLNRVLKHGIDTGDRTGTGMRSLFGETMEFDLRKGFPLVTTKKMFTRGVFGELLWFLSGSTSNKELEEKYNVKFWREWETESKDLPNIYGKQWVRWEQSNKIIKVKRKYNELKNNKYDYKQFEDLSVDSTCVDNSDLLGKVFKSKNHGEFKVLSSINTYDKVQNPRGGYKYTVQFLTTGYVKKDVKTHNIKSGKIEDPYFPIVEGVGFLGRYYNDTRDPVVTHLKSVWRKMLNRCYSSTHASYDNYGGRGIFVDQRWFDFGNFVDDVQKLPNWHVKKNNLIKYNLDKDYYGSNCYSKDTCVWLSIQDNSLYGTSEPFEYIDENGNRTLFISKVECANFLQIDVRRVCDILNNKYIPKKYRDYRLEYVDYDKKNFVYRYALPFNQIEYVINEIKSNPNSRRILYTGWNAPEMQWEDTALPCCHSTVVQFYVENENLHLYHYQRSGDLFLGVPVNIASYATLLTMVAQQCGLTPATIKHTVGVAHIYHNHIEQVEQQLKRVPYNPPILEIKRKPETIFDYNLEDFEIVGYEHHPLIKGDVAV